MEVDNFKDAFKYYKQKKSQPCLDNVINLQDILNVEIQHFPLSQKHHKLGLKAAKTLEILHLPMIPGLCVIRNPFTAFGQKMWSEKCLRVYPENSGKTNIHKLDPGHPGHLWESADDRIRKSWGVHTGCLSLLKTLPIWNLRWATLGYHHNWDTKEYSEDSISPFPQDLSELSQIFAEASGTPDYKPEAAIVNYYHAGSTLSPHTDHSEKNLSAPLVSISFGLPAIFLMGGTTKSQTPSALLIQSGDVIIMRAMSRLSYHAVPRIIEREAVSPVHDPLDLFMAHSRININVRQVNS